MQISNTRYAKAYDGSSLAYRIIGDGPIDLVWSFSFLSDVETVWDFPPVASFFRELASFTRLILHDRRGMGRSDRGPETLSLETATDDMLALLDDAGIERPVLAGPEVGGALSAVFAAAHPERAAAVVWYGAFAQSILTADYPWGMTEEDLEESERAREGAWGTERFAGHFIAANAPSIAGDPDAIRFFARWMLRSTTKEEADELFRLWFDIDLHSALAALRVPTLIMSRGEPGPDEASHTAALIPDAKLVALPGEDFMPFFDSGPVVDAIRGFVRA